MPQRMVWPVSSSVRTRKVGSSSDSRCRPSPSLSWSALVRGSMAIEITGAGKVMDSSWMGAWMAARVSPVVVFFKPTAATMSPVKTSSMSSR